MRRICVFCGSSPGKSAVYADAASGLGRELAGRGYELVYGGADVGLMGAVANAALERGGRVVGVIPESLLAKEVGHRGLTELLVVESMHERKAKMAELSDGFIALPGGIGTLEELFEILTWAQLGFHAKPVALLDVANYYRELRSFLDHVTEQRFVRPLHRAMLQVAATPAEVLDAMEGYEPPRVEKWLDRSEL